MSSSFQLLLPSGIASMSYIFLTLRVKSVGISNPNRDVRKGKTGSKVEVVKGAIGFINW